MFNKLYVKLFGFRIGQVVALWQFDKLEIAINNKAFKAYDARKGKYGYWLILNSDKNRYVIARKYKI